MAGIVASLEGLAEVKTLLDSAFGDPIAEGSAALQQLGKHSKGVADFFDRLKMDGLNAVQKDEKLEDVFARYDGLLASIVPRQMGPATKDNMTKSIGQGDDEFHSAVVAAYVNYVLAIGMKLAEYRPKASPKIQEAKPVTNPPVIGPIPSSTGLHLGPGGLSSVTPSNGTVASAVPGVTRVEMKEPKKSESKKESAEAEAEQAQAPKPKKKITSE